MYPALTVLQTLGSKAQPILWVGAQDGMEADLVQRESIPFASIPAAGVHGVGLVKLPANLWKLAKGFFASRRILKDFKPDVILFTGGYVAVPMALAATKVKKLLYVPDIEPGLALKFLARFADQIAVTVDESKQFFTKASVVTTGYPTRPELAAWDKTSAMQTLNLDPQLKTVLITGGSKGARSINQAIINGLQALLEHAQVIHVTGRTDWEQLKTSADSLQPALHARYHAFPYLHQEMGAAFAAADLVVCRAGASTLGELPLFALPAILVPYPYSWKYQTVNANYLAANNAAVILENNQLSARLIDLILSLLQDDEKLSTMRTAMKSLFQPNAAHKIAELLENLVSSSQVPVGGAA